MDQQSEVSYSLFLLYVQVEDYQNIVKLRRRPLAFTSYKTKRQKQKQVWGLSLSLIFGMISEEKQFFT